MKRVQLFNGRYTKGVPFAKNSIFKGKAIIFTILPLTNQVTLHTYIHTYFIGSSPRGFSESLLLCYQSLSGCKVLDGGYQIKLSSLI